MKPIRLVPAALLGIVTSAVASVALAAPAGAAVSVNSGCRFELVSVRAHELHENHQDEIYFEIGDDTTDTATFVEGQSRSGSAFGDLAQTTEFIPSGGSIVLQGWEFDPLSADEAIGGYRVYCTPDRFVRAFGAGDANYTVVYDVVALA